MEIANFTIIISTGILLVGLMIVLLGWAGVQVYAVHPHNPWLAITRAHGWALVAASLYSLILFSRVLGWLEFSPGWAFGWFLIANPIWVFAATLYSQKGYRVGLNNLH